MALEGMDVDQAQRLARQLESYAQALTHLTSALGTLTGELSYHWQGPASAAFQQQWAAQHRGALGGAAQALADMHAHLIANMQQQIQASAAGPGGGTGSGSGPRGASSGFSLGGLWRNVNTGSTWVSILTSPFDVLDKIAGYQHQSPALSWLHDNVHVQQAYKVLEDAHGPLILKVLGVGGAGVNLVNGGIDVGKAFGNVSHGQYASAGGNLVDATAEGIKAAGTKYPILYPLGVELSAIHKAYDQIRWGEGVPSPFVPGNFQNDWVPMFKSLPSSFVSTIWASK